MRMKQVVLACLLMLALVVSGTACAKQRPDSNPQPCLSATSASALECNAAANGYCYGYGTYYVATRRAVPRDWGDAITWYVRAQTAGYKVSDTPRKGAIAWTSQGPYGHVAIVEDVSADSTEVTISEMNGKGGWNRVTTRTTPVGSFKYIL